MTKLPFIFGRKKLLLAFEYGIILGQAAHKQDIEVTPELVEKGEKMVEGEFTSKSATQLAVEMEPNILSVFELDLSK